MNQDAADGPGWVWVNDLIPFLYLEIRKEQKCIP